MNSYCAPGITQDASCMLVHLIFMPVLKDGQYSSFTDERTGSEGLSNLPDVINQEQVKPSVITGLSQSPDFVPGSETSGLSIERQPLCFPPE